LNKESGIEKVLSFYMGKNTPDRQAYIMDNLRQEENKPEALISI
jgi:topoisomerase-4 subunit B